MKFKKGDLVEKNINTWVENDFDAWGRGIGIGEVVAVDDVVDGEVDVRWPAGRCYERVDGIALVHMGGPGRKAAG